MQYRQIFTDGHALPKDPNPTWNGYYVGTWDGRPDAAHMARASSVLGDFGEPGGTRTRDPMLKRKRSSQIWTYTESY